MKCVRKAKKWPLFLLLISIAPTYLYGLLLYELERSAAVSVGIPKYSSVL